MTLLVLEGVFLLDLYDEPEAKCEARHHASLCSTEVRWSRPAFPCGCCPRHLVCQATYDFVFSRVSKGDRGFRCSEGHRFTYLEGQRGWLPV